MNLYSSLLLYFFLTTVCYACASSSTLVKQPLKPTIGSSEKSFITRLSPQQKEKLRKADIILLGETHDHPQHHQLQAEFITWLKPQSVAFEMLNDHQQPVLDQIMKTDFAQWNQILAWEKRGWPAFKLYQPIFKQIHMMKIPMIAAHPDKKTMLPLKLGKELPSELIKKLALDQKLPAQAQQALEKEITISHCGYAPTALLNAMVKAQRLKDAWMARALLTAPKPVVLIVGRGHTVWERGIPWALRQFKVASDKIQVVDFTFQKSSASPQHNPHQIEVKTEAHRTDDPCERFKKKLEQMKKSHHKRMKHK